MESTATQTSGGELAEALKFGIGLGISFLASLLNAVGLNLLQRDHIRNHRKPASQRRHECFRLMWHVGLYSYVGSQVFGSTLALIFLKTQWVAPLGSISLILNFIFARLLVGTKITRKDAIGTIIVMLSVVAIVVFGTYTKTGATTSEEKQSLEELEMLYSRVVFIIYFAVVDILAITLVIAAYFFQWSIAKEHRRQRNPILRRFAKSKTKKLLGICFASTGGLIASETLLLAKSALELLEKTFAGNNQFRVSLPFLIVGGLIITAVLQVTCLNTALKLAESVIVVPIFYGFYTAVGMFNTMVYLDKFNDYEWYVMLAIIVGMATLCVGVKMLSEKKPDPEAVEVPDNEDEGEASFGLEMARISDGTGSATDGTDGPSQTETTPSASDGEGQQSFSTRQKSLTSTSVTFMLGPERDTEPPRSAANGSVDAEGDDDMGPMLETLDPLEISTAMIGHRHAPSERVAAMAEMSSCSPLDTQDEEVATSAHGTESAVRRRMSGQQESQN